MKQRLWMVLFLLPAAAIAESPQVAQNTADIAALKLGQTAQNQQLGTLKARSSANAVAITELNINQSAQGGEVAALQAGQAVLAADQVQHAARITALELTDPVPGPVGPQGPPGPPGSAPPGVSLPAAQIHSALELSSGLRWLVAEHYRTRGVYPLDNDMAGADPAETYSNPYVDYAQVYLGVIEVGLAGTAAAEIAGGRIFLLPNDPGSAVVWFDCLGDGVTDAYLAELGCIFADPPAQPYSTIRRQIASSDDLLNQADAQQAIQDYYAQTGAWPADNAQAGLAYAEAYQNRYVSRLEVSGPGLVSMTFGDAAHPSIRNRVLSWLPIDHGASIEWACISDIEPRYLAVECQP